MSQQQPEDPRASGARRSGGAGLVVAGCLVALTAVGLRAAVSAPALDGPFRQHAAAFGGVLEGVLACLLVALVVRHRLAPREAVLAARLRTLLTWVVSIALVVIAIAYLPLHNLKLAPRPTTQPSARPGKPSPTPTLLPRAAHGGGVSVAEVIVLVILAALAAAALAYLIMRLVRMYDDRWRSQPLGIAAEDSADEEPALREAVESGYGALLWLDDARAAIIACYAAMEESLARAGTVRAAADTPDELLARAASAGLVRGAAAALLTGLFYEARFSSHPMPRECRDDAERALSEIAAGLGDSAAVSAGDSAAASAASQGEGPGRG